MSRFRVRPWNHSARSGDGAWLRLSATPKAMPKARSIATEATNPDRSARATRLRVSRSRSINRSCPSVTGGPPCMPSTLLQGLRRSNIWRLPGVSGPFEALDVEHEDRGAAYFYFNGVREEELAWLHYGRNRRDLLLTRGAILANSVDHRVHISGINADEDRRVGFPQEASHRFDSRCSKAAVRELRQEAVGVLGLHNGDHELH